MVLSREALETMLAEGCSLEEIGRRVDRHPSTVSYWLRKHGLTPNGASAHAARGGIARETLTALVGEDLSIREIALRLGRSYTTVRYWLGRHELMTTTEAQRASVRTARGAAVCPIHGAVPHVSRADGTLRCARCRADAVTRSRQLAKLRLVEEFGGACALCGYAECVGALHFHHRDPATKRFTIGKAMGVAIELLREEAQKCVLLCSNCHMAVEAGLRTVPD
jgi:transposase